MRKANQADDFGKALDTLESAFSDSSRQGIRRIKTEWLKVLKYKNDLLAKENEVAAVKERIMHLRELKCQNEKYLHTAQSKLQNLKQSDIQLKGKLNYLKKEETRLVEKCKYEEEFMQEKLSFYEDKWRKRHETAISKNPQVQEKQKAIFEMEELKRKLLSLEQDFQKCEKDLFQAKCERNKRTSKEENDTRSFKNFVVKIAQMYVDTKKMFAECERTSQEIRTIEKNIEMQKMKPQRDSTASDRSIAVETLKNNLNIHDVGDPSSSGVELKKVQEINIAEQSFENNMNVVDDQSFMKTCNDDTRVPPNNFAKDNDYIDNTKISNFGSNAESKGSLINNFGNFQNNPVDNQNINLSAEIFEDSKITSNVTRKENFTSKFEKMPSRECKIRKWMEKLRIYVPTFGADEKDKYEDLGQQRSSESTEYKNSNEKKTPLNVPLPRETFINKDNSIRAQIMCDSFEKDSPFARNTYANTAKSSDQNKFSSPAKMQKSNMNIDTHLSEQIPSTSKSTSKYFGKNYSTSAMDWDEVPSADKNETAKVVLSERKEQNIEASAVNVQNNAMNKEDCLEKKKVVKFRASVETKEESKGNELFNKIQQTNNLSRKIPEDKPVEEVNLLLGQEDKNIDTEMVEITTEVNAMPDNSSEMDVADNQHDDLKANLQTLSEQNEKQVAEKKELTAIIPKPTTESTLPTVQPTVDQVFAKQLVHESKPHHDQVITYEQREGNEREVFIKKNEKDSQLLDSVPTIHQKDTISNISIPSPFSAVPTPLSIENSVQSNESNPKTPIINVTQASSITTQEVMTAASDFPLYKSDNNSPGFAYTTRLMYEAHTSPSDIEKSKMTYKDLPKDILAQLAFFNKSPSNMNFPPSLPKSPEDDRNDAFLASAYEDYLEDSPPVMKAKEKSMFQFADDSPEKGVKDDFFPLFGENNNGESSKDSKNGGQFTFNFGGNDEKSPEETSGFKFLF